MALAVRRRVRGDGSCGPPRLMEEAVTPPEQGAEGRVSPGAWIIWGVIVGSLLLLGLLAAAGEVRDVIRGSRSEGWPATPAAVTRIFAGNATRGLEYAYRVERVDYSSRRVGYSIPPFHQEYRLHDVGDTIQIRFNPTEPTQSVIRPGVSIAGLVSGLLPAVLSLACGLYLLTKAPAPARPNRR